MWMSLGAITLLKDLSNLQTGVSALGQILEKVHKGIIQGQS